MEGGHGSEGAVVPHMNQWILRLGLELFNNRFNYSLYMVMNGTVRQRIKISDSSEDEDHGCLKSDDVMMIDAYVSDEPVTSETSVHFTRTVTRHVFKTLM